MKIWFTILICLFLPNLGATYAEEIDGCKIKVESEMLDCVPPGIVINGLDPQFRIRVHVLRCMEKWGNSGEAWRRVPIALHSWADCVTDSKGVVELDVATPVKSIHPSANALSLLRNGIPITAAALDDLKRGGLEIPSKASSTVSVFVDSQGYILARATFELVQTLVELNTQIVAAEGLYGVFSRPKKLGKCPASGGMTRNIVERLDAAGRFDIVRSMIYPQAGHQIAGTGTFPVFYMEHNRWIQKAKTSFSKGTQTPMRFPKPWSFSMKFSTAYDRR